MSDPQPISPRQRLQELLAIPERQRTDAQWDELNELEIKLASGNRQDTSMPGPRRNNPGAPNHPQAKPGGDNRGREASKKFHKRPPKRKGQ
jgi:hypothetical protein